MFGHLTPEKTRTGLMEESHKTRLEILDIGEIGTFMNVLDKKWVYVSDQPETSLF
jgi:hypothetical protein